MGILQLGKDLSSESLSTFSELDATPLHYLIEDLKREIDAKDTLLQGKTESIVQLEERVTVREKELHRLKLRHDSASQERTSYEKRVRIRCKMASTEGGSSHRSILVCGSLSIDRAFARGTARA